MPKLKQPPTLESIAMDSLVRCVMQVLDELNDTVSPQEFRQGISNIKDNVRDRMPAIISSAFIIKFKEQLTEKLWDEQLIGANYKAAIELLMDVEITGLKYDETILDHVDPQDMHRLRGLKQLDLNYVEDLVIRRFLYSSLSKDLTTLTFASRCTDDDLDLLGKNCSKLQVLRIPLSNITDDGLCALNPCRDLRVVDITNCKGVSHPGLCHLLTNHKKLEELFYSNPCKCAHGPDAFDFLTRLEQPCSSMKRFSFKTNAVSDANLSLIATTFPNLTDFELTCERVGGLSVLKSLTNLKGISICFAGRIWPDDLDRAWRSLRRLLKLVGSNITTLEFSGYRRTCVTDQQGLQFIYEHCPNIERLKFDFVSQDLVVPPFRELSVLRLVAHSDEVTFQLERFEPLVNVEILQLIYFKVDVKTVKLMMLDDKRFPKLARFETSCRWDGEKINRVAREHNLDFILHTNRNYPDALD